MELRRLTEDNYDEVLQLMNDVFGRQRGSKLEFDKLLPNMWKRNDEYMGKHFGVFDGARLVSALGVYPLPGKIGSTDIMFSTTGNVVTHWEYEGKGCMNLMLNGAMEELKRIGADVSRLGGLRQRYSRFGFESCGTEYDFTLTNYNIDRTYKNFSSDITFEEIKPNDKDGLEYAQSVYEKTAVSVYRKDFYNIVTAWGYIPFSAKKNGKHAGYLVADKSGKISEFFGENDDTEFEMLLAYCKREQKDLHIPVTPYRIGILRKLGGICEIFTSAYPSRFKIINYVKVLDALLKLKSTYIPLQRGEATVEIKEYGTVRLFVTCNDAGCEMTNKSADFSLTYQEASRFFFGPIAPEGTFPSGGILLSWLPLPLGWNTSDRV